jgi:protein O-GlcNAc transferase
VQLTYLGYPGTSGLSAMDYRITDGYADTLDSTEYYSERLLRLPDSLCCYRPAPAMPELTPLPALRNSHITFGSFNNANKIDEAVIRLWTTLLLALPSSRLMMVAIPQGERRARILQQFEAAGVISSRIDFHGKVPPMEFYQLLGQVDLTLDPLLITGGTTTCESLWMGVPVIMLAGQRFIHRVGYSFLCSAGLTQYAASNQEEYIQIALTAAADIPGLARMRVHMRERLMLSPLMDQGRFTCNFERVLRDVWRHWCIS